MRLFFYEKNNPIFKIMKVNVKVVWGEKNGGSFFFWAEKFQNQGQSLNEGPLQKVDEADSWELSVLPLSSPYPMKEGTFFC